MHMRLDEMQLKRMAEMGATAEGMTYVATQMPHLPRDVTQMPHLPSRNIGSRVCQPLMRGRPGACERQARRL